MPKVHSTPKKSLAPKKKPLTAKDEVFSYVNDDGEQSDAEVIHTKTSGGNRIVGIGNIRVVIVPDGKRWCAQGLEIDYISQGDTVEEAKTNFENGLTATVEQHIRIHGSVMKMLRAAPDEVWKDVLFDKAGIQRLYSQVTEHEVNKIHEALPYTGLKYLVADQAA